MPFKLRLKKSRQYNVASKSLFVCNVELLDGSSWECTLTSESTGQDCLDYVCQRLGLNQPEFFGLQYMPKGQGNAPRWLEMERPVKRQLDKYATGLRLLLRVMFYITQDVSSILVDEISRYHYFLQLKTDVIEGRIITSRQQAVLLASYSMQAEFGNYDSERHTPDYLKDFQLFPKHMTDSDSDLVEHLTEAATLQHAALRGMPSGTAEERYIAACQQLDNYGQEIFEACDDENRDVFIGISFNGITVKLANESQPKFYLWHEISNMINHKRLFTLEFKDNARSTCLQLVDAETAKHVWRMCVLQHSFHIRLQQLDLSHPSSNTTHGSNNSSVHSNIQNNVMSNTMFERAGTEEKLNKSREHIPTSSYAQNNDRIDFTQPTHTQYLEPAELSFNQRAQSTSCLDLTASPDVDRLRALLPSYRAAPDYETAVRQKYRSSRVDQQQQQQHINHPTVLYSSQPEIRQVDAYTARYHYPDVTQNTIMQHNGALLHPQHFGVVHLYKPPPPYPSCRLSSNSTPDLAVASLNLAPQSFAQLGHVSGSSPDLVSTRIRNHQQRGKLYEGVNYIQEFRGAHGTYENLASVLDNKRYIYEAAPQAPTLSFQKVYDEHGNIIYCMPALLESQAFTPQGFVMTQKQPSDSAEPIYENVPLPWQNESVMRERTQSIQSAPEMHPVRLLNAVPVQPLPRTSLMQKQVQENVYANIQNQNVIINTQSVPNDNLQANQNDVNETNNPYVKIHVTSPEIVTRCKTPDISSLRNSLTDVNTLSESNTTGYMSSNNTSVQSSAKFNETCSMKDSSAITDISSTMSSLTVDTSQSSGASSKEKKRRRWALLGGRSKSSEKVKSATLGREKSKDKTNLEQRERYRWSTGLPRLQPLPPTISKETMCQLLERKLTDSQLFFEFEKIPKKKPNADFTTALHPDNATRNRYKDVLPYEENRVRLTLTRENKHGYVNASHITASVGNKQRFYIAAQGPSQNTLEDFWNCVWQADVYLIVQLLTDVNEDMCYIPSNQQRCVDVGPYQIWTDFTQSPTDSSSDFTTSKLRVCHTVSRHYRSVWHVSYGGTDALAAQSPSRFLTFLEEVRSVRDHGVAADVPPGHNRNPPTLVHCTAGVGRTGVTILCDLLLYMIDHNQELDIPRTVGLLRHQRAFMVQTITQYRFVYSLLIHYLKQTRLI